MYLPLLTQKDAISLIRDCDGIWKQNVTGAIQATVLKHPRLRERIPTDLSVNTDQTIGFTYPYQVPYRRNKSKWKRFFTD